MYLQGKCVKGGDEMPPFLRQRLQMPPRPSNYDKYSSEIRHCLDKAIAELSTDGFRRLLESVQAMTNEYKKDITSFW